MSFTKELKSWFFRTSAPINTEGKKINLENGSRPDKDLFERLTASTPFFKEAGDRARASTAGAIEDEVGIVAVTTDAKAKANTSGLEADRTLVTHASQLPTVDVGANQAITGTQVPLGSTAFVDVTADATATRNNFIVTITAALLGWYQAVSNWIDAAQTSIDANTSNISTNTTNIATITAGTIPVASITMYFGSIAAPTGWLICDGDTFGSAASGATHASDDYEILWKALYNDSVDADMPVGGGRGASASADWSANKPMNLPDFKGRTPFGYDAGNAKFDALAHQDGAEDVTLLLTDIPQHTHLTGGTPTSTNAGSGHTHAYDKYIEGGVIPVNIGSSVNVLTAGSTASTTSAAASSGHTHDTADPETGNVNGTVGTTNVDKLNPYSTINFIIKY